MGTRALIRIYDHEDKPIAAIYRHSDGYPTGLGRDLREHAALRITRGRQERGTANGMECFAAQVVAALKDGPGGIYLQRPDVRADGCSYVYHLYQTPLGVPGDEPARVRIVVEDCVQRADDHEDVKVLYDGLLADMDPEALERDDSEGF